MTVIRFEKDLQCPASFGNESPLKIEYIDAEFSEPLTGMALVVLSCASCGDWWSVQLDLSHLNINITQEMIDTTAQQVGLNSADVADIPF